MGWCNYRRQALIWVNSLVKPLVVSVGSNSGPCSVDISNDVPCNLQHRCKSQHFFDFPDKIMIWKPVRFAYYSVSPSSLLPANLRVSSRKGVFGFNTKVCDANCPLYAAMRIEIKQLRNNIVPNVDNHTQKCLQACGYSADRLFAGPLPYKEQSWRPSRGFSLQPSVCSLPA